MTLSGKNHNQPLSCALSEEGNTLKGSKALSQVARYFGGLLKTDSPATKVDWANKAIIPDLAINADPSTNLKVTTTLS